MQRAKTFLILVLAHLGLTLCAVYLSLYTALAALFGDDSLLLGVGGHVAEVAVWVLGSPVLTSTWAVAPGFWSTPQIVGVAALNSTVWVGSAVLLARRLHPRRPRLVSGLYPRA